MANNRELSQLASFVTVNDTSKTIAFGSTVASLNVAGVVTATTFSGNVTGNVTGDVTGVINTTGVGTITRLEATDINVSGASTFTSNVFIGVGASVGIGTDDPAEALHTSGNIRVSNSSDASQYLTITYQGIDFQNNAGVGSTGVTSHLLDDYEEGTFNATYVSEVGILTTYTQNSDTIGQSRYTKIGRVVHVNIWTATDGVVSDRPPAQFRVTGLPFNASSATSATAAAVGPMAMWNTSLGGENQYPIFRIVSGTNYLIASKNDPTVTGIDTGLTCAEILRTTGSGRNGEIRLSLTYITD